MEIEGCRLGVDFGTSNTVALLAWPDGRVRPLLFDGSELLPSAVCVDADGVLLVGRDALHAARAHPGAFEPHPKRTIDEGTVLLGEREFAVEELISAVLRRVATEATRVAGAAPAEVTLTHPAGWGPRRRELLASAAASAGLGSVKLVAEPVAAACYFARVGSAIPTGGYGVVYDFGAGTFDASVVRNTGEGFEVLATQGLPDVGGLDVDAAIVAHLGSVYTTRHSQQWARLMRPSTVDDQRLARPFWDDVRAGKEMLSRTSSTLIHVPMLNEDAVLGRPQLDELIRPILDRTVRATRAAVLDAGIEPSALAAILLVGGSSRIPLVATVLHESFGIAPTVIERPELVVGEGALHADSAGASAAVGGAQDEPSDRPAWLPTVVPPNKRRVLIGAAAAAVAVLMIVTLGLVLRRQREPALTAQALRSSSAPASAQPRPSSRFDQCVVGTWDIVLSTSSTTVFDIPVRPSGTGGFSVFRSDGTGIDDLHGQVRGVEAGGYSWQWIHNGTIEYTYQTTGGFIRYRITKVTGTSTIKQDGAVYSTKPMRAGGDPLHYECAGDSLKLWSDSYKAEYLRRP